MHRQSVSRDRANEPPVPEGTIGEWLDRAAELFGDREALVVPWQGRTLDLEPNCGPAPTRWPAASADWAWCPGTAVGILGAELLPSGS
jgi:hypothetical protein